MLNVIDTSELPYDIVSNLSQVMLPLSPDANPMGVQLPATVTGAAETGAETATAPNRVAAATALNKVDKRLLLKMQDRMGCIANGVPTIDLQ
jgi:hypothetical protein